MGTATVTGIGRMPEASNPELAQGGGATSYRGEDGSSALIRSVATEVLESGSNSQPNPEPGFLTKLYTRLRSLGNAQASGSAVSEDNVSDENGTAEPTRIARVCDAARNFLSRARVRGDVSAGSDASAGSVASAGSEEESQVDVASGQAASNSKPSYFAERNAKNSDVAKFNDAIEKVRKFIKDGLKGEDFDLGQVLGQVPEIYIPEARKACAEAIHKATAVLSEELPEHEQTEKLKEIANELAEHKKQDVSVVNDLLSGLAKGIGNIASWQMSKFFKKHITLVQGSSSYLNPLLGTKGATYQFFAKYATIEYSNNRLSNWLNKQIHDGSKLGSTKFVCTLAASAVAIISNLASLAIRGSILTFGFLAQTLGAVILTGIVLGGIGAGLYFGGHALAYVIGTGLAATAIAFAIFAVGSVVYAIYTNIRFNRLQKTLTDIQQQLATLQNGGAGRARISSRFSPEEQRKLDETMAAAHAELPRQKAGGGGADGADGGAGVLVLDHLIADEAAAEAARAGGGDGMSN
jgi:hypothetical protein